jgi:hypothetical protein
VSEKAKDSRHLMSGERSCFRQLEEGTDLWVELEEAAENLFQKKLIGKVTMRRLLEEIDSELQSSLGDIDGFCDTFVDQKIDEKYLRSSISTLRDKNKAALEKMMRLCESYSPFSCIFSTSSGMQSEESITVASSSSFEGRTVLGNEE